MFFSLFLHIKTVILYNKPWKSKVPELLDSTILNNHQIIESFGRKTVAAIYNMLFCNLPSLSTE